MHQKTISLFAIFVVFCFAISGCKPSVKSPPIKTSENSPNDETSKASAETVISGDLSKVDWKSLIGQSVTIDGKLVIVDNYDLIRRGQVVVARERLFIPTSEIDPNDADPTQNTFEGGSNVAKVNAARKFNKDAVITLDDGTDKQNIFPPPLFPGLGTKHPSVRVGSTIDGVTGTVIESQNKISLVAKKPLKWTPSERPSRPSVGDAKLTIASFNVLNYFTTIDNGNNNARGADSPSEFKRQEEKIVSAILELDADVVGLMEIENNLQAEQKLVAALNKAAGKEIYKGCGLPDDFREAPGGIDAIRVAIIYRTDKVTPVGKVSMIRDHAFGLARTPIVQSFKSSEDAKPVTVVVNHFKSKGGNSEADKANKDKGDGQAAFNAARRAQSLAICKYFDGLKAKDSDARFLVIGDLNAYQQEDPIDALRANGLIDLHELKQTSKKPHYSYIYYGISGSLDHAFASKSLASDVTGIATWHINADEPRFLDYNEEFNPKSLFKPDPFRSSDHDPVLIGISK